MRKHGTLTKWNDARGFGFISSAQSDGEVFVHISAFPRDGIRPRIDELISFETELGKDGKLHAIRIMRPGQMSARRPTRVRNRNGRTASSLGAILAAAGLLAYGAYHYSGTRIRIEPVSAGSAIPSTFVIPENAPAFVCDGRTRCTQMTSCEEARYFVQHCPDTRMDGDFDGEPCEDQWCQ